MNFYDMSLLSAKMNEYFGKQEESSQEESSQEELSQEQSSQQPSVVPSTDIPKTGDSTSALLIVIFILAAGGTAFVTFRRKEKE